MSVGFETEIIDIANDFYEAYLRCLEGKKTHTDEYGRIISSNVGVPAIVNGAFACELYMKSMIPKANWQKCGHNLQLLLLQLPNDKQAQIREAVTSNLDLQFHSYKEYLTALSNCFGFWRYIHEKENFGIVGFNGTIKALSIFLDTIRGLIKTEYKFIP